MNTSIKLIHKYIASFQFDKALLDTKFLLESNPNNLNLIKLESHIHGLKENYNLAIDILEKSLVKFPNDFDLVNNLGHYYMKVEKLEKSLEMIYRAKEMRPNEAAPYQNAAEVYMQIKDYKAAMNEIDKCIDIKINNQFSIDEYIPNIQFKIHTFLALGEKNDAIDYIKSYLQKNFMIDLALELVAIDKKSVTQNLVSIAEKYLETKVYESNMEKFRKLVPLNFFLANFYDKENQKKSEGYFISANQEIINIQRYRPINEQKKFLKKIESYEIIKSSKIINKNIGQNNIFIVGMPRSGTTLLESIITANKEVFAAGELKSFDLLFHQEINSLDGFNEDSLKKISDSYINTTNFMKNNYGKIVDKMPANYSYIGFIRKCFPSAKIILLLRDPWDIAISLFKQIYVNNIPYASSFFNIGVTMANFEASINFWLDQEEVKNNLLIIQYEDIVQNFEFNKRNVYDFCEIKDNYNDQIRSRHFAKTASMKQVQGGIHSESLKKSDFIENRPIFLEAFAAQREYWSSKGIESDEKFLSKYSIF